MHKLGYNPAPNEWTKKMTNLLNHTDLDRDVRHFIYRHFEGAGLGPSTRQTADALGITQAQTEAAYERLAQNHDIVLAPGSYSIWMAHPFSGLPTNYQTRTPGPKGKKYWGN